MTPLFTPFISFLPAIITESHPGLNFSQLEGDAVDVGCYLQELTPGIIQG